jgi:hypothetical protein
LCAASQTSPQKEWEGAYNAARQLSYNITQRHTSGEFASNPKSHADDRVNVRTTDFADAAYGNRPSDRTKKEAC